MIYRNIIDVSRSIKPDMTIWPGDEGVSIVRDSLISAGDRSNISHITMGLHTGTHIDSPLHFSDEYNDVSSMELSYFIGIAKVYEVIAEQCISEDDIRGLPIMEGDTVFFKTSNSSIPEEEPFFNDYIYMDESAARYLAEKRIKTVGIDYLSIESYQSTEYPVHKLFLSNNIAIIEGLMLKDVEPGQYLYCCMPLKIVGGEGSPVRAILAHY